MSIMEISFAVMCIAMLVTQLVMLGEFVAMRRESYGNQPDVPCERTETEPLPFADNEVEALRDALADAEAENAELRRIARQYHKVKGKGKKD